MKYLNLLIVFAVIWNYVEIFQMAFDLCGK